MLKNNDIEYKKKEESSYKILVVHTIHSTRWKLSIHGFTKLKEIIFPIFQDFLNFITLR